MKDKIIKIISNYEIKLDDYIHEGEFSKVLREDLIKQLKICRLALIAIKYDSKIEESEISYFIAQVFVGRHFGDLK